MSSVRGSARYGDGYGNFGVQHSLGAGLRVVERYLQRAAAAACRQVFFGTVQKCQLGDLLAGGQQVGSCRLTLPDDQADRGVPAGLFGVGKQQRDLPGG